MTTLSLNPSQFHFPRSFTREKTALLSPSRLREGLGEGLLIRYTPTTLHTSTLTLPRKREREWLNWGFIASLLMHGLLAALLIKAVFPVVEQPPLVPVQVIMLVEQKAEVSKATDIRHQAPQKQFSKPVASRQSPAVSKPKPAQHKVHKPVTATAPRPLHPAPQSTQHSARNTEHSAAAPSYSAPSFDAAYLRNPAPDYPAAAKRRRMQGTVLLSVTVSPAGDALAVRLKKSSGFSPLDAAAESAVKRWQFVPAKRGATPVTAQVVVPVEFRLAG